MDKVLWLKVWDLANTGVSEPEYAEEVCRAIVSVMSQAARPV
ncbi:hypothetical protein [Aquipuribacter hungaricus]|uniref:Uncharacterized protein n=1 Tax=Aquipuribacter hungaricus TaxID=545624 RepID=A0ABV7WHS4_9MICO